MRWLRRREAEPLGEVIRHARRVALGASAVALVIYLLGAVLADVLVLSHLHENVDRRLSARLAQLRSAGASPLQGGTSTLQSAPTTSDLDDAPIFVWWLPAGGTPRSLTAGAPNLPVAATQQSGMTNVEFAGRLFRVDSAALPGGKAVVATSLEQLQAVRDTLLMIEGSLLPVVLLSFYLVASVIGRRAAAPVERARQQQLDFTADASHELRTPLAVIEAEVGLALTGERDAASYRASLERVASESKRLAHVVEDLLWLARLDALPAAPMAEDLDLGPLVAACAARFQPLAARRGLELVVSGSNGPVPIHAPADLLERLLSVLLDNACRYVEEQGRITVSVARHGGRAALVVDDSGPGLSDAERLLVVQRFHRASSLPGGAGLGLAIADVVVRATEGHWEIGRSPLGGTRIDISWPLGRHFSGPDARRGAPGRLAEAPVADVSS